MHQRDGQTAKTALTHSIAR